MARHQKDALRPLVPDEYLHLEHLSRSRTVPTSRVVRAKELLAVANGASFEGAPQLARRKSGDTVVHLVAGSTEVGSTP